MEVPANILEVLKCSECENYLSRSPVYMRHSGAATCGACHAGKQQPANRMVQYEAAAQLLRFHCKYRDLSCPDTVPFAHSNQEIVHEAVCEFRQYVCPVLGSARCDWLGTRTQLLQHCRAAHPEHVRDNPCRLVHDITSTSLHNYLVTAFRVMFLVHTKVCVTTAKVFHAVRLLDAADKAAGFFYTLVIQRGDEELKKKGRVLEQGRLALQEPTALSLDINSLLSCLGGWDGVKFTLTLEQVLDKVSGKQKQAASELQQERKQTAVQLKECEHCERCAPYCQYKNLGCTYRDISIKHLKHAKYFCAHKPNIQCPVNTDDGLCHPEAQSTITTHYASAHGDVTHESGTKWPMSKSGVMQYSIIPSPAGAVICKYFYGFNDLTLSLYAPVSNERLSEFRCEVYVCTTERIITCTPDTLYSDVHDWFIELTNLPKNGKMYVCVDIKER